jgi:Anti-sigma-K factor rskA, C-terminal
MDRGPDFRELVGDELTPEERARLERVHELLVEAGPPPELPPTLAEPPGESSASPIVLPRRRAGAMLALAAAIALVAFVGGFVAGKQGVNSGIHPIHTLIMHGTAADQNASAKLDIGELDSSGNWPLRVVIHGLPSLPKGSYYEMYLTNHGKAIAACGIFTVAGNPSTVRLTMPPTIKDYDGWIVTRESTGSSTHTVVLTT